MVQAGTVRDSMAKSLYSALFDWIVFRINHALLNIKDLEETTKVKSDHTSAVVLLSDFKIKALTLQIFWWQSFWSFTWKLQFSYVQDDPQTVKIFVCVLRFCPSECSTFLVLRTTRTTALNSSASTSPTSVFSITSTSTSSSSNRCVIFNWWRHAHKYVSSFLILQTSQWL